MSIQVNIDINLNFDREKLCAELDSHFKTLKTVLNAIDDGSYSDVQSSNTAIIKMATFSSDSKEQLRDREINKCFKACIGALQDFLDKMIAIIRLGGSRLATPKTISSQAELQAFVDETLANLVQEVSRDRTLNVPAKLNILQINDSALRDMVDGYFAIRNSIEHHKGVASRDIKLIYRRSKLVSGNTVVEVLPFRANKGETISLNIDDEARTIIAGTNITLTEAEMEYVIECLKMFVGISISAKVAELLCPSNQ